MFWFGQTVVDVGFGAGELEGVGAEQFSLLKSELDLGDCGASIAGRGEVDPVVGEYGMDFVRNGLDQGFEEVCRDPGCGSLVQFDESELRSPVDGDQQIELALLGADLGDIDMEVADGEGLKLLSAGPAPLYVRQAGSALTLSTAVQPH